MNSQPTDEALPATPAPRRWRLRIITRAACLRIAILFALLAVAMAVLWLTMIRMPGKSHSGTLPPLTEPQQAVREAALRDVEKLAGEIGERNVYRYDAFCAAADYITSSFKTAGWTVRTQEFRAGGRTCRNIEAAVRGESAPDEIVVVGAHYDTVAGSPGANDNGSGVAGILSLARALAGSKPAHTLRLVAFANEECPFYHSGEMGSAVYARQCRAKGDKIVGMLSLETIGYYTDKPATQQYPTPLLGIVYPTTGNFVSFIGNVGSRRLVRRCVGVFRRHARFPSEGAAIPDIIPGVGWSDHWSFWQEGYPALMVTDTAPFRYPYYHLEQDTPDELVYDRLARVLVGLEQVVRDLAGIR